MATGGRLAAFRRTAARSGTLWASTVAVDRVAAVGMQRLWKPVRVPAARLGDQLAQVFRAWGMSEAHVDVTVERVLYADLRGIDSHGCCMLPFYRQQLRDGIITPRPSIVVVRESGSTALVDGGGGLGHVAASESMARAIEKAREGGVGVVAVRDSGHFGAAGAYAALAAEAGMIGIATCTTPTPAVVPTFGRQARLGTNPLAFAAPARQHRPFLLDMATSTASLGKLIERWRQGLAVPAGWAVNSAGAPMTNGYRAAAARHLTPLGGTPEGASYKGYGLAVAMEILAGVLTGVGIEPSADGRRPRVGQFFLALDPGRFGDGDFGERLDELVTWLRDTPPLTTGRDVQVAGDPERLVLAERERLGIPLARAVVEDLREVAADAGVTFLLDGTL
jgi:LDH2 family malate/lactate/ureidoglycolate dehydrogenase